MAKQLLDQPDSRVFFDQLDPLGRFGQPEDDATALLYLVSPLACLGTGTELLIAGGGTAQQSVTLLQKCNAN